MSTKPRLTRLTRLTKLTMSAGGAWLLAAYAGAAPAAETAAAPAQPPAAAEPELIFHAPFDGTAQAAVAKGGAAPRTAKGLEFAPGRIGQAVRITAAAKSVLAYAAKGNLVQERGTVSLWFKREWPDDGYRPDGGAIYRALFANPHPYGKRQGSGQLWFWCWGDQLRADLGDAKDRYMCREMPDTDGWVHFAVTWDESGQRIYVNGDPGILNGDSASPLKSALQRSYGVKLSFKREPFATFCVGGVGDGRRYDGKPFDGLIDDLRIYSGPLAPERVRELYRAKPAEAEVTVRARYALAGEPTAFVATATSPAGRDLSAFRYCLRDAAGKVVARFDAPVGTQEATLRADLPVGDYRLGVTDGTNVYGHASCFVLRRENPYLLTGTAAKAALKAPGVLGDLELVEDLPLGRRPGPTRFRAVGDVKTKSLGGVPYLEAGTNACDRFAVRFDLGEKAGREAPLYVFEIDYPDDAKRTADLVIQRVSGGGAYAMQVGYAAGDEYPNTGKILTHRVLYWTRGRDVALLAMTARAGAPAAIAAVRVYRVKGNALPAADVREPPPAPGAAVGRRLAALYYEDPSIGSDFATPSGGRRRADLEDDIDRTAALMKFTGENLFSYPGAWYQGLIDEEYNPRHHAIDFLDAWYEKFDREGLFVIPTVNPNVMPTPGLTVTRAMMEDGSLHPTPFAIHDTGKPNWGHWHDTPPNFNIHHPDVQREVARFVDALAEQGAAHPSFKGVCLHVTRHGFLSFGDAQSGYNDYTVAAFAKAKGLTLPAGLKAKPLRGADYAAWLRANAWEDWIQWRCDVVTAFYAKLAKSLAARRPDLALWVNYMIPADGKHPDFQKPDFMTQAWRGAGLDAAGLTRAAPNILVGQTMFPADYRWKGLFRFASPEAREHQRVIDEMPGFYANLKGASFPVVHQHDRYWESAVGSSKSTLSGDWLNECGWRVSTINPSGRNALRHFVEPLRFVDVLGVSKGGFLVGTYGMEDALVPFLQAFRALPAVVMRDVAAAGDVRVRQADFAGESYFYVVNAGLKPARVTLEFPAKTRNLVTGETFKGKLFGLRGETRTLDLAPYELRSFAAPKGVPALK